MRLELKDATGLVAAFPEDEFYLSEETALRAVRAGGSFNLIHPASGLKVDFMVAESSEFNERRFERSRRLELSDGAEVPFATPEDAILKKLEYYRDGGSEKHLRDIGGVLRVSGPSLDRSYLTEWIARLGLQAQWKVVEEALGDSRPTPPSS